MGMSLVSTIIVSIHFHCQTKNVLAAVQDAVRLARLKSDIPSLVYFLLELSGPGSVRREIEAEFPELAEKQAERVVSSALDRYFRARKIRPEEAAALGVEEGAILAFNSNQIDEQIRDLKSSLGEAKIGFKSTTFSGVDQLFWTNQTISLQHKIYAVERSKSNILNACFNYSSQLERTEYASESFARELINLTDGILVFLREQSPDAQQQLESVLNDLRNDSPERRSHLLTSTRRLINSLADSLCPPQSIQGLEKDKPINRLQYYLENAVESSSASLDKLGLERILRSIYDNANKGVHANVSKLEVQQSVLQLLVYLNALKTVAPFGRRG